jgi:hypothetical protein
MNRWYLESNILMIGDHMYCMPSELNVLNFDSSVHNTIPHFTGPALVLVGKVMLFFLFFVIMSGLIAGHLP